MNIVNYTKEEKSYGKLILVEKTDGTEEVIIFPETTLHMDALRRYERENGSVINARGANFFMERVNGGSASIPTLPESEWARVQEVLFPK